MKKKKVAIIGGGISGIASAHYLQDLYDITIFEAEEKIGGHANPVEVEPGIYVDCGFIIFNKATYSNFLNFLDELGVKENIIETKTSLLIANKVKNSIFSTSNLFNILLPSFSPSKLLYHYKILKDLFKFRKEGKSNVKKGIDADLTMEEYLKGYSEAFKESFIYPLGGLIWCIPSGHVKNYPAKTFMQFFYNHGNLENSVKKPWLSFKKSSKDYLDAFESRFRGTIKTNTTVLKVDKKNDFWNVSTKDDQYEFDYIIFSLQANKALSLIENPSKIEKDLLTPINYQKTKTYLHTDESVIPASKEKWGSWVAVKTETKEYMTYNLNPFHQMESEKNYLLTLNYDNIATDKMIKKFNYFHPIFTKEVLKIQQKLPLLNKQTERGLFFCGSYFGYGFHEDALTSGLNVSEELKERYENNI